MLLWLKKFEELAKNNYSLLSRQQFILRLYEYFVLCRRYWIYAILTIDKITVKLKETWK